MTKSELLHLISSTALVLALGLLMGYTAGYLQGKRASFPEFLNAGETNPGVATIHLLEARNGTLKGRVVGQNARLAYSEDGILELEKGSDFEIPLNQIDLAYFFVAETLPEGTQFIASKSGKYYYDIFDKRAFGITPDNRVYFKTKEEAEKAGYLEPK